MAHFAEIDKNNIVKTVLVVEDKDCGFLEFPESEPIGLEFLRSNGFSGTYKQTSYNSSFRKNYAVTGFFYDGQLDAFYPKQPPEKSWTFNSDLCKWVSPDGERMIP